MAMFAYRAFLSYSHRDSAWAKWLHRGLEGYHIDKDLVGRATVYGPVPKTLRPIFRDRENFIAGHSLTEQTLAALQASQFLIVICSPNAAQSPYVNEEVRYFKTLGRSARMIPVIVDGEPGNPEYECFPPALRQRADTDPMASGKLEEPLAADARPQGDGKEAAKLKVVAALLGVGLDEIVRRAARARKRRNRVRMGAAGAALLVVGAAIAGWTGALSFSSRLSSTLAKI
jgi:eukaryotic-like serine/threonine-protein kinase